MKYGAFKPTMMQRRSISLFEIDKKKVEGMQEIGNIVIFIIAHFSGINRLYLNKSISKRLQKNSVKGNSRVNI